jgi:PhzF family phenazine biosynthesis protein
MRLRMVQVDAFTDRVFAGNPAAVCPLPYWLDDATLASIAAENNVSETAFFVAREHLFELRWFTPTVEVDLCGHATLAAAFVIARLEADRTTIPFVTRQAGTVSVRRDGDVYTLDFPGRPAKPLAEPAGLSKALGGVEVHAMLRAQKNLAVVADEATVRRIVPDFAFIGALHGDGLIVTAPGDEVDFVSRYFAPHAGIDEDPVTGSAHCTLTPYWADRLKKTRLRARQVSRRGGDLQCELAGDRVLISGKAVLYLEGEIHIPDPPLQ